MLLETLGSELLETLETLCDDIRRAGGRALLVGGSVRDSLLSKPIKDLDLEVFGLDPERLVTTLESRFELDLVGRSFGVVKIKRLPIDVALPRRESKRGLGHKGFEVMSDPDLSFEAAAARRDFTINAMGLDPLTGELLDPWGGRQDLTDRILRHVSEAFSEDPLRVLRGMQFVARFELDAHPSTVAACRSVEPEGLPKERIFDEWRKLILTGHKISSGLAFLRRSGWIRYFPEIDKLVHCPQDPEWHPEGDVFTHTGHVLDAFARERTATPAEDLVVGLACLCHDFAKPDTTAFTDGRWRSPGHEEAGEVPTRSFLGRMTDQQKLIDEVVPLVREHLKPMMLYKAGAKPPAVRRLARRVGRIDRLIRVCRADHGGRPPLPFDGFPAGVWLAEQAAALKLEAEAPKPILQGRHLIALGRRPGPDFGSVLQACFEAQLDGEFEDVEGGLRMARRILGLSPEAGSAPPTGDSTPGGA